MQTNWTTCLDLNIHSFGHITKRRYKRMYSNATGFKSSLRTKLKKRNKFSPLHHKKVKEEICAAFNLSN